MLLNKKNKKCWHEAFLKGMWISVMMWDNQRSHRTGLQVVFSLFVNCLQKESWWTGFVEIRENYLQVVTTAWMLTAVEFCKQCVLEQLAVVFVAISNRLTCSEMTSRYCGWWWYWFLNVNSLLLQWPCLAVPSMYFSFVTKIRNGIKLNK